MTDLCFSNIFSLLSQSSVSVPHPFGPGESQSPNLRISSLTRAPTVPVYRRLSPFKQKIPNPRISYSPSRLERRRLYPFTDPFDPQSLEPRNGVLLLVARISSSSTRQFFFLASIYRGETRQIALAGSRRLTASPTGAKRRLALPDI